MLLRRNSLFYCSVMAWVQTLFQVFRIGTHNKDIVDSSTNTEKGEQIGSEKAGVFCGVIEIERRSPFDLEMVFDQSCLLWED